MKKQKLLSAIIEKGLSQKTMAEKLGICRKSFYSKMKNNSFCVAEAKAMKDILGLSNEEASDIFFGDQVN